MTPSARVPIRLEIVSEHAILREALRLLLASESDMAVGVHRDADILLVDIESPTLLDRRALAAMASQHPAARVVLLTPDLEDATVLDLLRCGVHGVVPKRGASDSLFEAIRAVAAGEYWAGRATMSRVLGAMRDDQTWPTKPFGLTPRERHIVRVLVNGCGNREIAEQCGISEKTVKHHLTNIYDKVGVSSRLELTVFALHHFLY